MKSKILNIIISSLLFSSLLFSVKLNAKEVDPAQVKKVALNVFSSRLGINKNQIIVSEVIPITDNGKIVYTIFNLKPRGHIIISNDDAAEPVIGYGLESHIDFESIPPGLNYLLGEYKTEISAAIKQKLVAHETVKNKWENYLSEDYNTNLKSYTIEDILLETNWGQSYAYNDSCPDYPGTSSQCLVGCVGVALGQVLNYWGCRVFQDGSVSYTPDSFSYSLGVNFYDQNYDWDDIGNNVVGATDQFLYHCALSVESDFGSSNIGTSSSIYMARNALNSYFGFNANYPVVKTSYTLSAWIDLLKDEIDSERPIIYRGECDTCTAGHAWVVDGYDQNNKFHCNWGWNGNYQDEFYSLTNLTPEDNDYTSDQRAVINIYPILDACSGLSGASTICYSNTSYSVAIPLSASVVWSKSSNLDLVGGNTSPTYTVNAGSSGIGFVTATIKNSQNQTFLTRTKNVWVGKPTNGDIDFGVYFSNPPNNVIARNDYEAIGILDNPNESLQGVTKYNWQFGGWSSYITDYQTYPLPTNSAVELYLDNYASGSQIIMVYAENTCGTDMMMAAGKMFVTDDYGMYMTMSPNPTSGETTLTIESTSKEEIFDENTEWELEIYSSSQALKEKITSIKGKSTIIQTQSWKEGIYVVRVKYKNEILTGKLVVKK